MVAAAVREDSDVIKQPDWEDFVHTGPDTLAGRYLRHFWQPVEISRKLETGRAKPIHIMSENFTLYRGETGQPHVLAFRCAHRGTQLSTGWVEGDDLRCFYHGWKYSSDGQCIEQPAEPEPFCNRIRIRSLPTEEYLGLVFAYFGEGEPPPLPRYPVFESFDGVRLAAGPTVWPCNYWNRMDNDPIHPPFVHRQHHGTPPQLEAWETESGMAYRASHPDGSGGIAFKYMPNVRHYSAYPLPGTTERWQGLSWRIPVDDENCVSFNIRIIPATGEVAERYESGDWGSGFSPAPASEMAGKVLRGEIPVQELETLPNALEAQDYVSMIGQGAIADRANEHLGKGDTTVIMLRNLWKRELRKLAEGEPLKEWVRPGLEPATGGD
ncbi:MAG TPA: Rieske 2Fe-2S domain-containing protein [Chloroflexota bacterium]